MVEILSNGFLLTKAIIDYNSNTIIPIWDRRIGYEDSQIYGSSYIFNGKRQVVVDAILNINTKELSLGIEINLYPTETEFNVGDVVFAEVKRSMYKSSVKEIIYADYDVSVYLGKDIEPYYVSNIKKQYPDIEILVDYLYCIKNWKPYYLLEDDRLIKWNHELYKEFK